MKYINIKTKYGVETIDEFNSFHEAIKTLKEYRLADSYNEYYISQRSTSEWREK